MGIVMCLHRCWIRRVGSAWLVLFAVTLAASASPQGTPPEGAVAAAPADVQLKVETTDGQTTFHIGEVIPLVLSFTSSSLKTYQIDMASYDRSGRLGYEVYAVEPKAGWDDPLKLYFSSRGGWIGGGLRGIDTLSAEPTVIRRELNEWVRFTRPGEYQTKVSSWRVGRLNGPRQPPFLLQGTVITLNIVEATPEWQQQTLERAVAVLNNPGPAGTTAQEKRTEAIKTLRYLGTKAAGVELARHLNEPELVTDSMLGIAGSPAREAIAVEMRTMLADPDFAVSGWFLNTMSVAALPADPAGDVRAQREALETRSRTELAAALSAKRNEALAVSATTIVEDAASHSRTLPPDLKKKTSEALAATFEKLPVQQQAEVLQYRWDALDAQTMLPVLRKVAQRYKDYEDLRTMEAYQSNGASAAALAHWYELELAVARPAVIEEILRPKPRFNASALGMLPDKELPEVGQPLAESLRETEDYHVAGNIASLIHRYADASVVPQVTAYLDERLDKLACEVQEPLLAYLLKQDPAAARPLLEKSLAPRGDDRSWCYKSMFTGLSKLQNSPLLEELAILALEHPDAVVVAQAAGYLKDHGSAAAEEPLLNRFAAWSKQWRGRESELDTTTGQSLEMMQSSSAGWQLMEAVALGQGWLADQATLQRLAALSVGPRQRQAAELYLSASEARPVRIQATGSDTITLDIAQYQGLSLEAAKNKLKQFPRGTRFVWNGSGDGADRAFGELSKIATAAGMEIVRAQQ
jgi:hypothetical protein